LGLLNKKGCQWSWCNKREANDRIYSNIDWALGNYSWFLQYGYIEAVYDNYGVSDHSPIVLCTDAARNHLPKPFRLLNVILQEKEFQKTVQIVWGHRVDGYTMYSIWRKLKMLGNKVKEPNKTYNSVGDKVNKLEERLSDIQQKLDKDLFNESLIRAEKEVLLQLEKWQNVQEKVYRQKSRAIWITAGDSNTKFFHGHLKARQAKNRISTIYKEDGLKLTDPVLVEKEFTSFFEKLLGTKAAELPCLD
ncbi:PREDICTED: uncharacterized protein LOC109222251, partial [Nicotiana attenuata]|uniref:uncharacterized protein LOC109222251 n=1 Tax=Nicotiana attenuata TaxID=49451 RepID=UPI000905932A